MYNTARAGPEDNILAYTPPSVGVHLRLEELVDFLMVLQAAPVAELVCPDFAVITLNNIYFGE